MKSQYHFITVLLLLVGLCTVSIADSSADILSKIQATFDQITNIHAVITQTNTDTSSNTATSYAGEVYFQKPDKLRINYTKPGLQNIVFDGDFLWIYTAELKQITKQKLESGTVPVPLLFFAGASNIDADAFRKKNFISPIRINTFNSITTYRIRIRPKSKTAPVKEQLFWVDATTFLPAKARITDANGIQVTVVFSNITQDIEIPLTTFTIPIPPGVELVDLSKSAK
ncbi:MAG: outer membrane lipoprotein carrier protein LolA [bacterium]